MGRARCAHQPPHDTWPPPPTPSPQEQLPDLNTHFRSQSFHTSMYASSWFLTLFLTTFPLPVATRVFDIFMYEVRTLNTPSSPDTRHGKQIPARARLTKGQGLAGGMSDSPPTPPPWESRTGDLRPSSLLQGLEIVFRVGLALLQVNQTELMQLDMEGMSQVGQEGHVGGSPLHQGHLGSRILLRVGEGPGFEGGRCPWASCSFPTLP